MIASLTALHLPAAGLVTVFGSMAGLAGLWLRLSWRVRQERARRGTLVALTRALPAGSELEERAADGTWLRITMSPGTATTADGAVHHAPGPGVAPAERHVLR